MPIQAAFVHSLGVILSSGGTFLRPEILTYDHIIKMKWFVIDVTAVGSPATLHREKWQGHFCAERGRERDFR